LLLLRQTSPLLFWSSSSSRPAVRAFGTTRRFALEPGGDSKVYIREKVRAVLRETFDVVDADPMVTVATKFEFGDYQCNAALGLAKRLKSKPRDVAERLKEALDSELAGDVVLEVAGPGFLNVKLADAFLTKTTEAMARDFERAATPLKEDPTTVVLDYSSPNVAKDMHVGHLRSTVIGDALGNALEHNGHRVVRLNHVGDWGTQFGMLIALMEEDEEENKALLAGGEREEGDVKEDDDVIKDDLLSSSSGGASIGDLVGFYRAAKKRFDESDEFKERARKKVVDLQSGDPLTRRKWTSICEVSRREFRSIYERLGISANLEEKGESAYNSLLEGVVLDLVDRGLAVESDGALVVFEEGAGPVSEPLVAEEEEKDQEEAKKKQKKPPMIVRKSDGGFNYATTDLAAAKYRVSELGADRILYVTDAGQASHFQQVFDVVRRAEIVPENVRLEHVPFGLVQGEDGKKFKTRSGDTVKLKDLLDEARTRASNDLEDRRREGSSSGDGGGGGDVQKKSDIIDDEALAETIGIAAIKYADLSQNRESNYRFSFDKMLALNGNTAPYMLYSMARIAGIQRKCEAIDATSPVVFVEAEERNLARVLARFAPTLSDLEADLKPNILCDYLFDLAQTFNRFYEACPVRNAESPELAASRAALCAATASALRVGLGILGIPIVERM